MASVPHHARGLLRPAAHSVDVGGGYGGLQQDAVRPAMIGRPLESSFAKAAAPLALSLKGRQQVPSSPQTGHITSPRGPRADAVGSAGGALSGGGAGGGMGFGMGSGMGSGGSSPGSLLGFGSGVGALSSPGRSRGPTFGMGYRANASAAAPSPSLSVGKGSEGGRGRATGGATGGAPGGAARGAAGGAATGGATATAAGGSPALTTLEEIRRERRRMSISRRRYTLEQQRLHHQAPR